MMLLLPATIRPLATPMPAAPAPLMTMRASGRFFPTTFRALMTAASTMMPAAWFSWCRTAMRTALRMRDSMVKHLGAAMLSRQKPPKVGARVRTISTISSASWVVRAMGTASTLAKVL